MIVGFVAGFLLAAGVILIALVGALEALNERR